MIEYKKIIFDFFKDGGKPVSFLVVKYTDSIDTHYWVKYGNVIDVTTRNVGKPITGIGANKYQDIIRELIFKFEWENDDIEEFKPFTVIEGGLLN